jgi:mRNA-degrading endonuclease toxin of MazEF toxin-antitoxin module
MVEVALGEIWWADLPGPAGSAAGFRRPVVVVQGNPLNRSRLATVVCVPLTSNLMWEAYLGKRIGKLTPKRLEQVLTSIDVVLGR